MPRQPVGRGVLDLGGAGGHVCIGLHWFCIGFALVCIGLHWFALVLHWLCIGMAGWLDQCKTNATSIDQCKTNAKFVHWFCIGGRKCGNWYGWVAGWCGTNANQCKISFKLRPKFQKLFPHVLESLGFSYECLGFNSEIQAFS